MTPINPHHLSFLKAALIDGGRIRYSGGFSAQCYWHAGDVILKDRDGSWCSQNGYIAPVLIPGSRSIEKWGHGDLFRLTEKGMGAAYAGWKDRLRADENPLRALDLVLVTGRKRGFIPDPILIMRLRAELVTGA